MSIFQKPEVEEKAPVPVATPKEVDNETPITTPDANKEPVVKDKQITLTGPLSHLYSQALNIMYAKENYMMIVLNEIDKKQDEDALKAKENLYVYAMSADELDTGKICVAEKDLRMAMESKKYDRVILALEASRNVSNKVGMFEEHAKTLGVQVYLSGKRAMESIGQSQ